MSASTAMTIISTTGFASASTVGSTNASTVGSTNASTTGFASETTIKDLGLASPEELELNNQAFDLLVSIESAIVNNAIPSEHMVNFKPIRSVKHYETLVRLIKTFVFVYNERTTQLAWKFQKRSKTLKKRFNRTLNDLLPMIHEDSILYNLLFINGNHQFERKTEPKQRVRIDFNSPYNEPVGNGGFIFHASNSDSVIKGGRTEFDSAEACLSAMRACLENCVNWNEHVIQTIGHNYSSGSSSKQQIYGRIKGLRNVYHLKIKFIGSDYWEPSDSPRLRHILCNSNPPRVDSKAISRGLLNEKDPKFSTLYPHYAEFLRLVRNQFKQIIRNSHNNPDCPYTTIHCCRMEPICNNETIYKKSTDGSKLVVCGECKMDLCSGGCGRIYHGETPCEISLDEATNAFVQETSKPCPNPNCNVHIHKTEGCNHMTCSRCRTEFCWICGDELPRDDRGHYSTALHFSPSGFGIGRTGGCNQFS